MYMIKQCALHFPNTQNALDLLDIIIPPDHEIKQEKQSLVRDGYSDFTIAGPLLPYCSDNLILPVGWIHIQRSYAVKSKDELYGLWCFKHRPASEPWVINTDLSMLLKFLSLVEPLLQGKP